VFSVCACVCFAFVCVRATLWRLVCPCACMPVRALAVCVFVLNCGVHGIRMHDARILTCPRTWLLILMMMMRVCLSAMRGRSGHLIGAAFNGHAGMVTPAVERKGVGGQRRHRELEWCVGLRDSHLVVRACVDVCARCLCAHVCVMRHSARTRCVR
jgi:hypothetical protein